MNVSLTQAAAAMTSAARWQEMISQNLAAGTVPGFKRQEVAFSSIAPAQAPNTLLTSARVVTNFSQGNIRPTGAPTDVALDGPGFFEIQLPGGQPAYTRDGEFRVDPQGQLVTKQGYPVVGDGGAIQLDLNNPAPISIGADGTVSQGAEVKGKLKAVAFSDPSLLQPIGQGHFLANAPGLLPAPTPTTAFRQGFLESGNASPVTEMAHLIAAMRQFEATQRLVQAHDDRLGKAISELGNPNPA